MILVISGWSCAGKDTAQDFLAKKGWGFIVSTTSRPIRPNEVEGKNYYFVTRQEFENKIKNNELLEYRSYNTLVKNVPDTWYYGVETCHVDPSKNLIAVLDSVGYEAFVKKFGKENVKLLWIDLDDDLRRKRNMFKYIFLCIRIFKADILKFHFSILHNRESISYPILDGWLGV